MILVKEYFPTNQMDYFPGIFSSEMPLTSAGAVDNYGRLWDRGKWMPTASNPNSKPDVYAPGVQVKCAVAGGPRLQQVSDGTSICMSPTTCIENSPINIRY